VSNLQPTHFADFFKELYEYDPFPWQMRLAQRVCEGNWPKCIALPTAAGKTACINIAVFALAYQSSLSAAERTAPRRIFFVVDRRIVVDQAYLHAEQLAKKLKDATKGIVQEVAEALRKVGDSDRPLDYYALRGGMYRESTWVRSPLQPTVLTSTVDQVGSRLLFRGYGVSDSLKPIHAGLVGNDSLILLDEAHCAKPFEQTVSAVSKYRCWADQPLQSPFTFVSMTATPAGSIAASDIERDNEDDHNDKTLGPRIKTSKPTRLHVATKATGKKWRSELVKALTKHAQSLQEEGFRAIGIIVNRVATARETAAELRHDGVEVILLTGRMRPMDRDDILKQLEPLFSGSSGELNKPTFVVATQCLEVGADLDFHALVTECASLDALRQRFGRLNRVAARSEAKAVVVVRGDQIQPTDDISKQDPVYGNSLANTWQWLKDHASDDLFDFGVAAVRNKTETMTPDELAELSKPTTDAAVLLPAHLDLWCQTYPIPMPDPDPSVFLHGPTSGTPDVQVVFRADLIWNLDHDIAENERQWIDVVSICPPSSSEALPVRLDLFKRWLSGENKADDSSDVEGDASIDEVGSNTCERRALRWKGPGDKKTGVIGTSEQVMPGDLYVLQITSDADLSSLGDFPEGLPTDQGDEAFQRARDRVVLRLTPLVHKGLPTFQGIANDDEVAVNEAVAAAIESLKTDPRELIRDAAETLAKKNNCYRPKPHPFGGYLIIGRKRLHRFDPTFIEADESFESASDQPVLLVEHCRDVAACARRFADSVGLPKELVDVIELAGRLHDCGKADPRFQVWLHQGNRRRAELFPHLLAKSIVPMPSRFDREIARQRAGYPKNSRHELLSVRLAESDSVLPTDRIACELSLHLIASHHGCCRPFAPVVNDFNPVDVSFAGADCTLMASSATALERLDSGVAERFWKLTRQFGWWGLPWLESLLRLADWSASEMPSPTESSNE
jgi:CRISPR-associated endonuclease/helicase Cas3